MPMFDLGKYNYEFAEVKCVECGDTVLKKGAKDGDRCRPCFVDHRRETAAAAARKSRSDDKRLSRSKWEPAPGKRFTREYMGLQLAIWPHEDAFKWSCSQHGKLLYSGGEPSLHVTKCKATHMADQHMQQAQTKED